MAADQVDTIVGANVELKGSLHNDGPIHVHGRVHGDITSNSSILIGETAIVDGPVTAKQVEVAGQVNGSITAEEQIELQAKSIVRGDIITNKLSIKPGAIFVGTSQMNAPAEEIHEKKNPRAEID